MEVPMTGRDVGGAVMGSSLLDNESKIMEHKQEVLAWKYFSRII